MNRRLLVAVTTILIVTGCVGKRIDLVESESITLDQRSPANLKMSTSVYNDDGNLVILGRISRDSLNQQLIPGHIDVLITDSNGAELSIIQARFRKLPTWRHGPNPVAFRVELPGTPPHGSKVIVKYDTEVHSLRASEFLDLKQQGSKSH